MKKRSPKEISIAVESAMSEILENLKKDRPLQLKYNKKMRPLNSKLENFKKNAEKFKSEISFLRRQIKEMTNKETVRRDENFLKILTNASKRYQISEKHLRTVGDWVGKATLTSYVA